MKGRWVRYREKESDESRRGEEEDIRDDTEKGSRGRGIQWVIAEDDDAHVADFEMEKVLGMEEARNFFVDWDICDHELAYRKNITICIWSLCLPIRYDLSKAQEIALR